MPVGFHLADMAELERKLGFNPRRKFLIDNGLRPVARELVSVRVRHLYVGGSFASAKPSPNDIDGYFLARLDSDVLDRVLERQEIWRTQHLVDVYPAFVDIDGYGSKTYWEQWFSHTGDDPPKERGIIELVLGR